MQTKTRGNIVGFAKQYAPGAPFINIDLYQSQHG